MPNRSPALMMKALVLIMSVAVLATADVRESSAQQKKKNFWDGIKCECVCSNGTDSTISWYNAIANCSAYNRKTCNFETSDGLIRTGSLKECRAHIPDDYSATDSIVGNGQQSKPKRPKLAPWVKPAGRGTN